MGTAVQILSRPISAFWQRLSFPLFSRLPVLMSKLETVEVSVARSRRDRRLCAELVVDEYVQANLFPRKSRAKVRQVLKETADNTVLVAVQNSEVVATLTLFADGPQGLPTEPTFPEFGEVRRLGRVSEIGNFACKAKDSKRVLLPIMAAGLLAAMRAGNDFVVLTAHPSHSVFYRRVGFILLADEIRTVPKVDAPGVGLAMNLNRPNEFTRGQIALHTPRFKI